ncbi:hypothetical protein OQI99_01725 [Legionella sp. PATHC039]|nr:hypothetical protein [Legionella sp. PATHC039]
MDRDFNIVGVSHELRTPLMLILGPLGMLLAEKKLPSFVQNTLRCIQNNAQTLLKHVNDLLNISKLDARAKSYFALNLPNQEFTSKFIRPHSLF